jgi:uncharacterized beta-barrel protein YwiB (DUF1934 family)
VLKRVALTITTERFGVAADLFDEMLEVMEQGEISRALTEPVYDVENGETEPQQSEMFYTARLRMTDTEFSLTYEESELTGMEGSESQLSFRLAERGLLTMLRTGSVTTALVFEQGKRHMCVYQTPYMPFEVCVHTLRVDNRLAMDGRIGGSLDLDYVVELRGAQAERCQMHVEIREM